MESYEEVYSRPDLCWGAAPNEICRRALSLLDKGGQTRLRAIDLGCGEGRDVIHLARQGSR